MRPAAVACLLAALALLAWVERTSVARDAQGRAVAPAAGSDAAREDALLLRGVELALAGGRAPTEERMLDGGRELTAGRAPLVPALLAGLARRSVLRGLDAVELGALPAGRLAGLFERLGPLLGVLAVLASFAAVRLAHGGAARDVAGLVAAGLYALAPAAVLAERAGRVEPAALVTLLGCGLLLSARVSWGARLELDRTTAALLGGPLVGLALVAAPSLTPLGVALLVGVGLAPKGGRALALALAGALLVVNLVLGAPRRVLEVWPSASVALPGSFDAFAGGWLAWVLLPTALVALALGAPRTLARATCLVWGALALAWAVAFDPRAPGVNLAACALFALAAVERYERLAPRARPLALGVALLVAAPCGLARRGAAFTPDDAELARRADWAQALEVLRTTTPSSGPWNHAGARPDAFVLCAPEVAVEVVAGARRAVVACDLPRLLEPEERRAGAADARALRAEPATAASAERLARRSVRYVLVGPGDPPRAPGGLAERLATCAPDAGPPGFERVWASPARDGSGPACALWAVR